MTGENMVVFMCVSPVHIPCFHAYRRVGRQHPGKVWAWSQGRFPFTTRQCHVVFQN